MATAGSSAWAEPLRAWGAWLTAAGRPSTTRRQRDYQLRRAAQAFHRKSPWDVTTDELLEWLAAQSWGPESRRAYRAALRSFYGWAHAAGRTTHNPAADLPAVRAVDHPPRPTPELVLQSALAAADDRTRLMILLGARQGLRRGEIAQVRTDDVQRDIYGWTIRIRGKGNRVRVVPLLQEVRAALSTLDPGWAFPGQINGHLSPEHVGKLLSRALGPGWSGHTLRHRFASAAYAPGRDLLAVQRLLGHAKLDTTRGYVRLPDDALRAAIAGAA